VFDYGIQGGILPRMERKEASTPPPYGDIRAYDHAISAPMSQVVRELVDLLGATTVAVIGGVGETRAVQQWMADRAPQRPNVLRFALQLAIMIGAGADTHVVRAWFAGGNPHLGDAAPLTLLRDEPLESIQGRLLLAARGFAARE
jgi:hypothetical protein